MCGERKAKKTSASRIAALAANRVLILISTTIDVEFEVVNFFRIIVFFRKFNTLAWFIYNSDKHRIRTCMARGQTKTLNAKLPQISLSREGEIDRQINHAPPT